MELIQHAYCKQFGYLLVVTPLLMGKQVQRRRGTEGVRGKPEELETSLNVLVKPSGSSEEARRASDSRRSEQCSARITRGVVTA